MLIFYRPLNYPNTRPLMKFGPKPMTIGVMMGGPHLMLAYLGMKCTCHEPLFSNQSLFYLFLNLEYYLSEPTGCSSPISHY